MRIYRCHQQESTRLVTLLTPVEQMRHWDSRLRPSLASPDRSPSVILSPRNRIYRSCLTLCVYPRLSNSLFRFASSSRVEEGGGETLELDSDATGHGRRPERCAGSALPVRPARGLISSTLFLKIVFALICFAMLLVRHLLLCHTLDLMLLSIHLLRAWLRFGLCFSITSISL